MIASCSSGVSLGTFVPPCPQPLVAAKGKGAAAQAV